MSDFSFHSIEDAIEAISRREMVIVVDDETRENEGDLMIPAEHMTEEFMARMIRFTGGVVCLSLDSMIADRLELPLMVSSNTSRRETAFTVSIDAASGIESGISAKDRAWTVQQAASDTATPSDFSRPGHIFPLRAHDGGVLRRAGHTEASVDLCSLAGLRRAAAISELMNEDGSMMRLPQLFAFAKEHGLVIVSVADLIAYRRKIESFIELRAQTDLQTTTGLWQMKVYKDLLNDKVHTALVKGVISPDAPTLVRVHSECFTGDVLGSLHCDCGQQLAQAMREIAREGVGVVLYMEQEGRGIGLIEKIKAYQLQHAKGLDTVQANAALGLPEDLRDYGIGAQILKDVGLKKIRLMTNNPKKMSGIGGFDLDVVEQVPIEVAPNDVDHLYLKTKKEKMGHLLSRV